MTGPPDPRHLSNRHRDTLRRIFEHPLSHNIDWRAALALLEATGSVDRRHDGKFAVTLGSTTEIFERPTGKDLDPEQVLRLRPMLTDAGYLSDAWEATREVSEVDAEGGRAGREGGPM